MLTADKNCIGASNLVYQIDIHINWSIMLEQCVKINSIYVHVDKKKSGGVGVGVLLCQFHTINDNLSIDTVSTFRI